MTNRTLNEWLRWLETLSPREIVLGLERVAEMLSRLAIERPDTVVNVAGTNGKGSSVAMLEGLYRAAGARTGAYTSPHVQHYNERIRIDGQATDDASIIAAFERVEAARDGLPLTYFEFGTLAALVAFDAAGVDTWLLEVGMGGRLDAVNAVDPDGCLVTNVSLDHCAWLGFDVESIAAEKAGILRGGKPAVYGAGDVPKAIVARANEIGAELLVAGKDFSYRGESGERWSWRGRRLELPMIARPALPGDIQLDNASAVLALVEALGRSDLLEPDAVSRVFATLELEGRFQVVGGRWILDVAHNPGASRVLAAELSKFAAGREVVAVVGMLADKDVAGIVAPLQDVVTHWIAVSLGGTRATSAIDSAKQIANAGKRPVLAIDSLDDAMEHVASQFDDSALVLVCGSFYVVGPALEWLRNNAQ